VFGEEVYLVFRPRSRLGAREAVKDDCLGFAWRIWVEKTVINLKTIGNWLDGHRDWTFEFVRIYLGVGLVFKGIHFVTNRAVLDTMIDSSGLMTFWMPLVAHYVVVVHIVGGTFLAIGFFTRAAALAQLPILTGALFLVHLKSGLFANTDSLEFTLLVYFLVVLSAVHGAGHLSVDHYIKSHQVTARSRPHR